MYMKNQRRKVDKTREKREMGSSIASRWRELSGENNWEGLLQHLDPDLRRYIIHYAERTVAAGDLFNSKTGEPDASKRDFFTKACLVKGNPYEYNVTQFLYAGSDDVEPSWFGYVAVATDNGKLALGRRDILVSWTWRGTSSLSEWLNDFNCKQVPASDLFPTAKEHNATVHQGFHHLYTGKRPHSTHCKISVREQVLAEVKKIVKRYKDEEISITVTGFSLGAALASLTAIDIVANGYNKPTSGNQNKPFMVTAFTYGGPRVGNIGLACVFDTLGDQLHLLRLKNHTDFVPDLPPMELSYSEFGEKLIVNSYESNYLKWGPFGLYVTFRDEVEEEDEGVNVPKRKRKRKRTRRGIGSLNGDEDEDEDEPERQRICGVIPEFFSCHNMDVYGHAVAIKDIDKDTPIDKLDHDLPLVNKHLDRVKTEYKIPSNWWTGENRKKMDQQENGRWVVKS